VDGLKCRSTSLSDIF